MAVTDVQAVRDITAHPPGLGARKFKDSAFIVWGIIATIIGLGTLVTWLLIAFFFRYSSLAALVAAVFAPLWYLFLFGPDPIAAAVAIMSMLLVWRHAGNIQNLLSGKEGRIGQKKA